MSCVLGPLVAGLTNKYGCRPVTICGSVLAAISVAISSFSPHINMLIVTYGLLAGAFLCDLLTLTAKLVQWFNMVADGNGTQRLEESSQFSCLLSDCILLEIIATC